MNICGRLIAPYNYYKNYNIYMSAKPMRSTTNVKAVLPYIFKVISKIESSMAVCIFQLQCIMVICIEASLGS